MPLFVLTCLDKPGALPVRLANREAHLAHIDAHRNAVRVAGPLLNEDGEMAGSLLVLEVADRAAAEAFSAADPYAKAGLFDRVEIRAWRPTIGALP